MKLTDALAEFLVVNGVTNVFGVSGGAACHIFDSINKFSDVKLVFNHHEQASALAATASTKINGKPNVCVVTTGPGGTNTLTGLLAAWQDSVPTIFVSGQVRSNQLSADFSGVRQRAIQEYDITKLVQPLTKAAITLRSPDSFWDSLHHLWQTAIGGRPGPVWLDIPLDLQWLQVDQKGLVKLSNEPNDGTKDNLTLVKTVNDLVYSLRKATRPLFLLGGGAVSQREKIIDFSRRNSIPCVCTWQAANIFVGLDRTTYCGRVGIYGQRGANIIAHEADTIFVLGSSLGACITGNIDTDFAPRAKIFVVNIDHAELSHAYKAGIVPVNMSISRFVESLNSCERTVECTDWLARCQRQSLLNEIDYKDLPLKSEKFIEPYAFLRLLSAKSSDNDVFVADGGGTNLFMAFQAIELRAYQQLICSTGICAMGTGLPEAIGVSLSKQYRSANTICLIGDGSLQFNVHELQTIRHHNLNIKVIVFNNDGYLAIRHTQRDYFDSKFIGSDCKTLSLPDTEDIANAYSIPFARLDVHSGIEEVLGLVLCDSVGPFIVEVMIDPAGTIYPVQDKEFFSDGTSKPKPLCSMYPPVNQNVL